MSMSEYNSVGAGVVGGGGGGWREEPRRMHSAGRGSAGSGSLRSSVNAGKGQRVAGKTIDGSQGDKRTRSLLSL